jgi:hypothetical protein
MKVTSLFPFHSPASRRAIVLSILLVSSKQIGQSATAEDPEASLQQIRKKVADHLSRLPNYTCHEMINRVIQWLDGSERIQRDRVDLEVAFLGKRELFAYPGDSQFRENSIIKMVPNGTIGNGTFGAHANAIFLTDAATFHYVGITKKDHRKAYRFDFEVPAEKSTFAVKHGGASAIVSYHGSIWADCETLDLVRIDLRADRMPAYIGLRYVAEYIHYGVVQIGENEVLLPDHAEIEAADISGTHSVDLFSLENCRKFSAESSVAFGEPLDKDSDNSDNSADRSAPPN